MIKAVLFDLDGTLLPMDYDKFSKAYFGSLAKKVAPLGYEPEKFVGSVWAGVKAMVKNNSNKTNEEVFWDTFAGIYGEKARDDEPYFEEYYKNNFIVTKEACGFNPKAKEVVNLLKNMGVKVALATNPLFPKIATEQRIEWAGLDVQNFELVTTYENSLNCKPNPEYYKWVAKEIGAKPEECLMVGNDVQEDMVASSVGMQVFLLTDCLLNKGNDDISVYAKGNFDDLILYLKNLLK